MISHVDDVNRATNSGLKQTIMDTSAYEMFVLACTTSMDGFPELWETTNSPMVPFKFNQVSYSDASLLEFRFFFISPSK